MRRHVFWYKFADVSAKLTAFFFRVMKQAKQAPAGSKEQVERVAQHTLRAAPSADLYRFGIEPR
jgi:hypothetical protein